MTAQPLAARRALLQSQVMARLDEPIRESSELDATLPELVHSVKANGLEGLVYLQVFIIWTRQMDEELTTSTKEHRARAREPL
jgi:hypothetical protein